MTDTCNKPADITRLLTLLTRLDDWMTGAAAADVETDEGTEPTRAGLIEQMLATLPARGVTTEAALLADLGFDNGTLAMALDTGTFFVKLGQSGAGSWTPAHDRIGAGDTAALTEAIRIADEITGFYGLARHNQAEPQDGDIIPVVVDELQQALLGLRWPGGELISAHLGAIDDSGRAIAPVVADANGALALGIDKVSGQVLCDPHSSTAKLLLAKMGIHAEVEVTTPERTAWAVTDLRGRCALSINFDGDVIVHGKLIAGGVTTAGDVADVRAAQFAPGTPAVPADINMIGGYGQSLSIGSTSLPPITTTQPYANIAFNGGTRPDGTIADLVSFIPLVEDRLTTPEGGVNHGETPASTSCNTITALIEAEDGLGHDDAGFDLLGAVAGRGGWSIAQLSRDAAAEAGQSVNWYTRILKAHLQAGYDLAQQDGKTFACQAYWWMQGEADVVYNTARATYLAALRQLQDDIEADAQAISGQAHRVPLVSYQLSWGTLTQPAVALAQLDAAELDDDIYIAFPTYAIAPFATLIQSGNPDNTHLSNAGSALAGAYFGRALKRILYDGLDWRGLSAKSLRRQGRVITLDLHVPSPPVTIDPTTLGALTNEGFRVRSGATTLGIESVEIAGPERLRIVLDADPGGSVTVRYGLDYDNQTIALFSNAAGGTIRDSAPETHFIGQETHHLYNWLLAFEKGTD